MYFLKFKSIKISRYKKKNSMSQRIWSDGWGLLQNFRRENGLDWSQENVWSHKFTITFISKSRRGWEFDFFHPKNPGIFGFFYLFGGFLAKLIYLFLLLFSPEEPGLSSGLLEMILTKKMNGSGQVHRENL